LRGGEGNAAHDDRDQELAINTRSVVGDGFREPPTLVENIRTEAIVITQIATARRRPIS